jgi:hypothetical protein
MERRDEEDISIASPYEKVGSYAFPPSIEEARATFENIKKILVPE